MDPSLNSSTTVLQTRGISKCYGVTMALENLNFELVSGETHALFGENGAGKSTLVKILSGATKPDGGDIFIKGQKTILESPAQARGAGIATVFQDFSLIPTISVLDNLFLGRELVSFGLLDR